MPGLPSRVLPVSKQYGALMELTDGGRTLFVFYGHTEAERFWRAHQFCRRGRFFPPKYQIVDFQSYYVVEGIRSEPANPNPRPDGCRG